MANYVKVGEVEMTVREYRMLKFIIDSIETDRYHQPPSHRDIVEALNKQGEKIISTEQTMRVAYSLRKKSLLVEPDHAEGIRRARNLVPTQTAFKIMKKEPIPVS